MNSMPIFTDWEGGSFPGEKESAVRGRVMKGVGIVRTVIAKCSVGEIHLLRYT